MRVLLINSNREKRPFPLPPIGLASVASYAERCGFEVLCLDLCFSRNVNGDMRRTITEFEPEAIGVSVRNIDNSNGSSPIFYLPDIKKIIALCRKLADTPIIVGGSAISVAPEPVLGYLEADYAVAGDGEEAFVGILNGLRNGNGTTLPAGVLYRNKNESITLSSPVWNKDLDHYPAPQLWRWIDYKRYAGYGTAMPVQTKRGCAFKCIYCTYPNVEGANYRLRSTDAVVDEIAEIKRRTGVRQIEFVDSTFNVPEKYAKELCEKIVRKELHVSLQTSSFNPKSTSAELFDLMQRAGFTSLVCTPESGSDDMLERIKKGFTTEHIVKTARLSARFEIPFLWVFLFGNPGETEHTVNETLQFIERHIPKKDGVFMTTGVRVYPNTPLERLVQQEGGLPENTDLVQPFFYISPKISKTRLHELVQGAVRSHPNYSTISDIQLPFLPLLLRAKTALRIRKPLWEFAPYVNKVMNSLRMR
ncbi:MAG: B12-binding domain-containing radical SAM protein [bacterium]